MTIKGNRSYPSHPRFIPRAWILGLDHWNIFTHCTTRRLDDPTPKSSMGNTKQPRFDGNTKCWTPGRHLVGAFDLSFSQQMFNARNTYKGMTSSSSGWQPTIDFVCFDDYTRRDDVLPTTSTVDRTSNLGDVGGVKNEERTDTNANPI
ncbi:hypothetical protein PVK06_008225 [Gossypium arboreum]|uniref:Uncharacterized protein n=1 Tax=Gossypium arboreum TaxID=29729 RepID=A0ABR0QK56_GOSAR|nr:hypothetical protein PVK06_008225 [Gossypium arboreum]